MEISEEGTKRADGKKFTGYLSVKGTSRFSTLVFTTEGGGKYKLIFDESKDTFEKDEIKSMAGLKLEIEGQVSDQGIIFRDYRIVPDEGADIAVVGIKGKEGTMVDQKSGKEFAMYKHDGELFLEEEGSLMWVIGKRIEEKGILVMKFGVVKRWKNPNQKGKMYLK